MLQRIVEKFDLPNPVSPKILDYASRDSKSVFLDIFIRFETHIKIQVSAINCSCREVGRESRFLQSAVIQKWKKVAERNAN